MEYQKIIQLENEKISTKYPYALTKRLGEELVYILLKFISLMLPHCVLMFIKRARATGTYGAVFGVFLAQKIANKPFTVVGNGKQKEILPMFPI